ncbi:class I adenylate-forming enzyme family protein [Litorisediminicola beolgyonensis]|uniref:Class I adenylate-forming enzyme family protein n=1 Tax=Litorisediminicola beolgyonensis TaxID=1173614 RepID=A0ABW3ZJN8_9RHOB
MLSIFDRGAPPPAPAPFNLAHHVLTSGAPEPDKIALAILDLSRAERWSYARLEQAVRGTATGLLDAGLAPGDRVLMRLGNDVSFPIAYLGAIAAGLVPVPTSALLTEGETARILSDLAPRAILRAEGVACPTTDIPTFSSADMTRWRDLPPAAYHMGDPDRLAYIVYTSGTSGAPRAVCHAHRAIWARRMMIDGWYGLGPSDRLLHAGAFNWTFTLGTGLMDPWTMGATALIPAPGVRHDQLALLMKRHEATIFAAAPGVYRNLLKSTLPPMPKLRHGLSAGEKLSPAIRSRWTEATGTEIHEAYGMSECSTFISQAPDAPSPPETLGRPQPGRRVAILGPDGPVPRGEPGEIAVHQSDPGMMLRYHDQPEETAQRFRDGWFLTGDRGIMGDGDTITYLGRGDDMMNAGGVRVSPIEVESALSRFPGITEIGATDIEVKDGVRVIAAFYTGPEPLDPEALARFAEAHLARYKQPRLYIHLDTLPKNPNGKLLRRDLARHYRPPSS